MTFRSQLNARILVAACISSMVVAFAPSVHGADGEAAAAEQLFHEALKLMGKGQYEEACPRLAESQKLDPGYGTLMHLGDCYVKVGKTASAWASYREAVDAAKQSKQSAREKAAQKKADALEPKLSKLTIDVPKEVVVTGLVIRRDGKEVGEVLWRTPSPIDPGKHEIEATAPGKLPWTTSVEVGENENAKVVVTALANAQTVKKDDGPKKSKKLHPMTIGGIIAGGVGLAAMGASVGVGFASRSRYDDSATHCTNNLCDAEGLVIRDDALSIANIGTGVFIGGAVVAAAGIVLVIVSPPAKVLDDQKTAVRLRMSPGNLFVEGSF